jgi:hypothetical protein
MGQKLNQERPYSDDHCRDSCLEKGAFFHLIPIVLAGVLSCAKFRTPTSLACTPGTFPVSGGARKINKIGGCLRSAVVPEVLPVPSWNT